MTSIIIVIKKSLVNVFFMKLTSAHFFVYGISDLKSQKKYTTSHVDKTSRKIVPNYVQ